MQSGGGQEVTSGPAKAAGPAETFVASRSDSHTPRGTPSARANPSARSHSSSNTSASHVHPSPPSSAVRPAPPNGLSWRHAAAAQAFDAPAPAIPQNGGRTLLQPPQSRAMLPAKGRHGGSAPSLGAAAVVSATSLPSSVTDPSAFDGAADDPPVPPPRHMRPAASFDQKRNTGNDRSPYPSTGPHTPSGRLVYTPRCAAALAECLHPPGDRDLPHSLAPVFASACVPGCAVVACSPALPATLQGWCSKLCRRVR